MLNRRLPNPEPFFIGMMGLIGMTFVEYHKQRCEKKYPNSNWNFDFPIHKSTNKIEKDKF